MSERPTALVIDDERQIRKLLRILLEDEYRVFESETGRQGLQDIATRRPDVVLLDLGLPDVEGMTVLKRLREWSRVPVLILSVREGPEDKVSALDSGADHVRLTGEWRGHRASVECACVPLRAPTGAA